MLKNDVFLRALKQPVGPQPVARVEISPDGMRWLPEGSEFALPAEKGTMMRTDWAGTRFTSGPTRWPDPATCVR